MTNIPDIVDGSVKVAQLVLESFGLQIGEVTYVDDFATNAVLKVIHEGKEISKEEIQQGYPIEKGSAVDLIVGNGLGKSHMAVPDLTGMPMDEVEQLLLGLGLKIGQIEYVEVEDEVGTVIRQSPTPEEQEEIRVGEIINIWVSGFFPGNGQQN
jgi:beta-lactam-binding protein with PASTA domain